MTRGYKIQDLHSGHWQGVQRLLENASRRAFWFSQGGWRGAWLFQWLREHGGLGLFVRNTGLSAFILYRRAEGIVDVGVLATSPQRQRQGDMRFLLTYLLSRLEPGGELWLEVHAANEAARCLYGALGFVPRGRRPNYYRDGGDAITYTFVASGPGGHWLGRGCDRPSPRAFGLTGSGQ